MRADWLHRIPGVGRLPRAALVAVPVLITLLLALFLVPKFAAWKRAGTQPRAAFAPALGVLAATARDPASHAWAGAYRYSNDKSHPGCPPGFVRVSEIRRLDHSLGGRLAANSAHLFRHGHEFEVTGFVRMHRAGPGGLISAYGSGALPILSGGPHFVAGDSWTVAHLDLRGVPDAYPFDGDAAKAHRRFTVYDFDLTHQAGLAAER